MTPLTFVAIFPLIVIAVLILTAIGIESPGLALIAAFLLMLWFISAASFKHGADWQHAYTIENYNIKPK